MWRRKKMSLGRLKTEGKIREYGIALDSVYDAVHCLDMEGLASLQMPFGLMDRQALDGVFDKVSERQLGIIARGCFGCGALKQSLTEAELRASEPQWERALQVRRVAGQLRRSPLEAALQFALSIEQISVTILGMRTPEHVATNLQYYAAKRPGIGATRRWSFCHSLRVPLVTSPLISSWRFCG